MTKKRAPTRTKSKQESKAKELRNQQILIRVMEGVPITQIAEEFGMTRQGVSLLLNHTDITKPLLDYGQGRINGMIEKAIKRVDESLDDKYNPAGDANAIKILKSLGLIKDKVDLSHSFPEPVVIRRKSGETVVLGTKADEEKGDGDA